MIFGKLTAGKGAASAALLAMVLLVVAKPAQAYIDPGSGALIWQGLIAALFGALFYVRRFLQSLRGRRTEPPPPADAAADEDRT